MYNNNIQKCFLFETYFFVRKVLFAYENYDIVIKTFVKKIFFLLKSVTKTYIHYFFYLMY